MTGTLFPNLPEDEAEALRRLAGLKVAPDLVGFWPEESLLAYEFAEGDMWDGDNQPFDASLGQSPFYPQNHGSYVVDILHQSGVGFQLLPVRYPRPDMALMRDAVDWLAAQNASIVMMPLGSQSPDDWTYFFAAAERHPEILFIISAGNNGVDLGELPIYPAVNALDNAITVTSTMLDGRLADG